MEVCYHRPAGKQAWKKYCVKVRAEVAFKPSREWKQPLQCGLAENKKTGQVVKSMLAGAGLKQFEEQIM